MCKERVWERGRVREWGVCECLCVRGTLDRLREKPREGRNCSKEECGRQTTLNNMQLQGGRMERERERERQRQRAEKDSQLSVNIQGVSPTSGNNQALSLSYLALLRNHVDNWEQKTVTKQKELHRNGDSVVDFKSCTFCLTISPMDRVFMFLSLERQFCSIYCCLCLSGILKGCF